ncbi:hypothetical protein ACE41Q_17175, partial [Shigella flexneri]
KTSIFSHPVYLFLREFSLQDFRGGSTCLKAARAAIDVNNVAFRKFGFAGTPWVLSDTGWHLPTGILQETGTLNLFLKTTDSESGHE